MDLQNNAQESASTEAPVLEQHAASSDGIGSHIWLSFKMFLADIGVSAVLGFILGLILGAASFAVEGTGFLVIGGVLGLLISAYIAYAMYSAHSSHMHALIALVGWGLLYSLTSYFVVGASQINTTQSIGFVLAQVIAYGAGWYVAKSTNLQLYSLKGKWLLTFVILGGIVLFLTFLGFLAILSA